MRQPGLGDILPEGAQVTRLGNDLRFFLARFLASACFNRFFSPGFRLKECFLASRMMSSCCTFLLNRRSALSSDSPSWTKTSAICFDAPYLDFCAQKPTGTIKDTFLGCQGGFNCNGCSGRSRSRPHKPFDRRRSLSYVEDRRARRTKSLAFPDSRLIVSGLVLQTFEQIFLVFGGVLRGRYCFGYFDGLCQLTQKLITFNQSEPSCPPAIGTLGPL